MSIKIFPGLILLILFFSCKKDDSPQDQNNPSGGTSDTLSAGWSKKVLKTTLIDIFFINNTGFAIGSTSGIYKSTDGGNNWTMVSSALSSSASNIGMGSETNAAFTIGPQKIMFTQNGGASFDTVTVSDMSISDVFFVAPSIAYALGNSLWKTTDGCSHWTKLYDFSTTNKGTYQTLYFLDEQTGWAARPEGLFKTTNGGVDWQAVSTGGKFDFQYSGVVFFVSPNHGFVADENSVGASVDGGANWNKVYSGTGGTYHDLFFLNDNVGYMTDLQYILKTTDGGLTWAKETVVPGVRFFEVHFTDANHGWACGDGVVLKYEK